jgi:late competence protein required for DNA uptake (superfamily II DNA/RNA helicase)
MCGTADSLMVTQYVLYSGQFNADTACIGANDSVYNESALVQLSSAIYRFFVLTTSQGQKEYQVQATN